jgi:flagellar capping protein FliD
MVNGSFSFLTGAVQRIESLGIKSNGDDNNLALPSDADLDAALSEHLDQVKALFTTESTGLGALLTDFLDRTAGTDGSLVTKQDKLDEQSAAIDDQIVEQERQVQAIRDALTQSFLAMENAQLRMNQQLQFLTQRFGKTAA